MCVHALVHTCTEHIVALQIITEEGRMGRELLSCVRMYALLLQSTWRGKALTFYTCYSESTHGMSVQLLHFNIDTFHNYLQWQQLKVPMC